MSQPTNDETKKIHAELKQINLLKFSQIKNSLGINSDAEVIRYLISYYHKKKLSGVKVNKVMSADPTPQQLEKYHDLYMKMYGVGHKKLGED